MRQSGTEVSPHADYDEANQPTSSFRDDSNWPDETDPGAEAPGEALEDAEAGGVMPTNERSK